MLAVFPLSSAKPVLASGTYTGHRPVQTGKTEALGSDLDGTIFLDGEVHAPADDIACLRFHLQGTGDDRYVETAITFVFDNSDII
jgi:hypothetical protein